MKIENSGQLLVIKNIQTFFLGNVKLKELLAITVNCKIVCKIFIKTK